MRSMRKPIRLPALLFLAVFFMAGCASQGIQLPESEFLRFLESKSGRIAYLGMDGHIYTIDQAGGNQHQITDDLESVPYEFFGFRHFSWSPDGTSLAYIGFATDEWTVNIAGIDGQGAERLYGSAESLPAFVRWTPDGTDLSLVTASDPFRTGGSMRFAIHTLPVSGGPVSGVIAEGYPLYYSMEPGGSRAVVHIGGTREENPDARIVLVDRTGGFERNLELPPASFQTPAWSPDGTGLLMAIRDVQGRNALVLANLQGQTRQTITTFEGTVAFSWSQDGRKVGYIVSERGRQGVSGPLTIVDPYNLEDKFTTEENLVHAFFWSPDSEQVVYFTHELLSDEGQENLFYGMGIHFYSLKDEETRHFMLGENLFTFQPTPQFRQYLSRFDQYQQSATIWSPDGQYILIPAVTQSQGVILVVLASGTLQPRHLVDGLLAFWSPEQP